jgi:hypothetical protein
MRLSDDTMAACIACSQKVEACAGLQQVSVRGYNNDWFIAGGTAI